MREYHLLTPEKLAVTFTQVKGTLPDSVRDIGIFAQLYWAKTSAFFELGNLEGALWLVNISIGWKAIIHLVLWGERLRHRVNDAREILRELMDLFQLCKVEAYIPVTNEAALKFTIKAGFVKEGILKQWDRYDGQLVDIAVYSILKEN